MSYFPFVFEGRIERIGTDSYSHAVLRLPDDVRAALPFEGRSRLRVTGEIADRPVEGAWQPAGRGRFQFLLSRRFLRESGLRVGDPVEMRFLVADQDSVDVPEALSDAVAADPALAAAWEALTPGARRAFAHRVASAKTKTTRARRVVEVSGMVLRGERPGGSRTRSG